MARMRQCIGALGGGLGSFPCFGGLVGPGGGASSSAASPAADDELGDEPPYRITVENYQRRGPGFPVVFEFTIRRGVGEWPIRRRFQQIWALHMALARQPPRLAAGHRLPAPPARVSLRSQLYGHRDRTFLNARKMEVGRYLAEVLQAVPNVENCQALRAFLFQDEDVEDADYERLSSLGQMLGPGERARREPSVDGAAVFRLPRALPRVAGTGVGADTADDFCAICQEHMDTTMEDDDIRALPCGHHFHFRCISRWLKRRNACCICQRMAIPAAAGGDGGHEPA